MTRYIEMCDLLVWHIDNKSAKAYKGTKYKSTYIWYHDAESAMTDNDYIE